MSGPTAPSRANSVPVLARRIPVLARRAKRLAVLAAAVAAAAPPQAVLAGLTHRYSFTDGGADGSTVTDSVGGANGVLVNRSSTGGNPPQFFGGQVAFNNLGTSADIAFGNYVDLPNNIAKTTNVTIEGWATWGGGNNWQRIFDIGRTNVAGTGEQIPTDTTGGYGGRDYFFVTPQAGRNGNAYGSEIRVEGQTPVNTVADQNNVNFGTDGQHHFALVIRGGAGGAMTLFRDGVQVATAATALDPAAIDQVNTWIGRSNFAGDSFFNGSINEFRIYDTAQTASQIAASAGAGPDALPGVPVTRVWNVAGPSNYNTAANWNPTGVPVGGDTVVFANGGQATVSADTTAPVLLSMQNGRIAVDQGVTYAVAGADIAPGSTAGRSVVFDIAGTLGLPGITVDGAATSTGTAAKAFNFTAGGAVLRASGSLNADNVTLGLGTDGGTVETPANLTLRAAVTGTGTLVKAGGGQLTYIYPTGNTTDLTGGGRSLTVDAGNLAVNTNGNNVIWTGSVGGPTDVAAGAFFKQGTGTLTLRGSMGLKTNFHINQGAVVLDGAAASVTSRDFVSIGLSGGDNGSLTVQNGAKFTVNTQDFNVSDIANTTGTLLVTGLGSVAQGPNVFIGKGGANTTGTATVRNDGALTATNEMNVANNTATGRLLIEGGTVTANTLRVGRDATAVGAVRQTGGTMQRGAGGGDWQFGTQVNAVGTYDLSGGTLTTASNFQIGAGGTGQLTVSGTGAASTTGGFTAPGRFAGSTGYVNVLGGTYTQNSAGQRFIVGEDGTGFLVVGGPGTFTSVTTNAEGLQLSLQGTGNGTVVLGTGSAGGTMTVPRVSKGGGTGRFFFNGGTLVPRGDSANFMEGITNGGTSGVVVQAAGGTINTDGKSVTINQPLVAPAGNGLASVPVTAGGSGYTTTPIVRITPAAGDAGVGATAVATIDASGTVTGIQVTNPGTGYAAAPTVTLVGGVPTTPATAGAAALTAGPLASGGITKIGAGTLTLGGANTYAGTTTVSAGTLLVNGSLAGGATVAGGSLGGSGSIAGPVSIAGGSTLAPGNSPGTLTVAGVTLSPGSTFAVELAGTTAGTGYDQLVVTTGGATITGSNLTVAAGGFPMNIGDRFVILSKQSPGAVTGTFAQGALVTAANGATFAIDYFGGDGNDVTLIAQVPEPASLGLAGLAALGLLARRRRSAGRPAASH